MSHQNMKKKIVHICQIRTGQDMNVIARWVFSLKMEFAHRLLLLNLISPLNFFIEYPTFIKNRTVQNLLNMKLQTHAYAIKATIELKMAHVWR